MIYFIIFVYITVVQGTADPVFDENYCYNAHQIHLPNKFGHTRWLEPAMNVLEDTPFFIPCCVDDYSSIQWYLNDISLKDTNSSFSVSKKTPQFIVSQGVRVPNNKDKYKCIAFTKDGRNLTHETTIFVYRKYFNTTTIPTSTMMLTYPSYVNNAKSGDNISFRCSAFLGFGPLEIYKEESMNWTITPSIDKKYYKAMPFKKIVSGGSAIICSVLEIPNVPQSVLQQNLEVTCIFREFSSRAKLIEYVDPARGYKLVLIILVLCIIMVLILVAFIIKYHIEIRMVLKDRFAPLENSGDFDYDVFVCYCRKDGHDTVGNILLPQLESLGYKCYVYERDTHIGANLSMLLPMALKRSRRMLVVVSPGLFRDGLALHMCHVGVHEVISKRSLQITTVLPPRMQKQKLPEQAPYTEALRSILRVSRHVSLPKNPEKMQRFWHNLRLGLPPRRNLTPISYYSTHLTPEFSISLITNSLHPKNIDDK